MAQSGRLIIVSGPSGVGKDTVIDAWTAKNPRVQRVIACTTRPPREGEADGVHYHFLSLEQFNEMAAANAFLEFKEVHGNYYATPIAGMEKMLAEGKIAVLKIDVQGALAVMAMRADIPSVFLLPPSWEELERRIRDRGTDDEATIQNRLQNAREEIALAGRYRYRLVNEDVDRTVEQLEELVR